MGGVGCLRVAAVACALVGAGAAGGDPSNATTGAPFTLQVEQRVLLSPPEWQTLEIRDLEERIINAVNDAARTELQARRDALRDLMERDRACVLLGRAVTRGATEARPTAVLVPAGRGGSAAVVGSSVRVTPTTEPWPALGVGEAARAFPELRLFGSGARPGFVAESLEVAGVPASHGSSATTTAEAVKAIPRIEPSPWSREAPACLAASGSLVVEQAPEARRAFGALAPVRLLVRNTAAVPLPASQVYIEFFDGSGALVHREFRWLTERRTVAEEARIPALAPGAVTPLETVVPASLAPSVASARVLIMRAFPAAAR